jgi:(2Fe-2S) ferredoxin
MSYARINQTGHDGGHLMTEMIPSIPPYGRQLFLCTNGNCAGSETVVGLLQHLRTLHRKHGRHRFSNPERVIHVPCGCLGVCVSGPIMVVYPDGIWYHQLDEAKLTRIYEEHLLAGRPVVEYLFHRHFPAGQEPAYAPDVRADETPDALEIAAEAAAIEKEEERKAEAAQPVPDYVQAARDRRRRRSQKRAE